MLLKDLCTMDPAVCATTTSVIDAARLMRAKHVGDLIVIDNENDRTPLGIVTDRDIVMQVVAEGLEPSKVPVNRIMVRHAVVATADESIDTALKRMREFGVRRIPVTDREGSLMGVVSLDDVLKHLTAQGSMISEVVAAEQDQEKRTRR